jgi:hypothetical protein
MQLPDKLNEKQMSRQQNIFPNAMPVANAVEPVRRSAAPSA